MQSVRGSIRLLQRQSLTGPDISSVANGVASSKLICPSFNSMKSQLLWSLHLFATTTQAKFGYQSGSLTSIDYNGKSTRVGNSKSVTMEPLFASRCITTEASSVESASQEPSAAVSDVPSPIKFKRLDKMARNIMQILDREAVEEVRKQREIPDIKPGYIVQLKVEVPENKRRNQIVKGIVIARRNAGINTTIRLRRLVAGVGVESLFPLYSPNLKDIKVLDKKKVRRAKLYYLRDKMNALKRH